MKRLVIFDLDGTLLNTIDDLAEAGNHMLAAHGFPVHTHDAYKFFVGDGVAKLVERCSPESAQTPELQKQLLEEFGTYYAAHSEDQTRPYDGVADMLDGLKAEGVTMAVLSNKPHTYTLALCAKMFGDCFAVVHGKRDGYPPKPDAVLVDEILALTGIEAKDCLYVGDSGVDMQTAKNGGVFALGVLWGFRPCEELVREGADALVSRPSEILNFLR